jgi:NAD(P)-dependent dehydrogenase (short-subunit alcohol dehydrogenase family)
MELKMKIALVTGANKGLGFGASKKLAQMGFKVLMVGRGEEKIKKAITELKNLSLDVEGFVADVSDDSSVEKLSQYLNQNFKKLDVLINNAGILIDNPQKDLFNSSTEEILKTFNTNTLGAYRMVKFLGGLLLKGENPCIVNISSGMGQLSEMEGLYPGYRMSKTALNALTKILAKEYEGRIKVNSICPGWVKTDMGGPNAPRSIEEAVKGIIWAATLPLEGPSGQFFRDGKTLEW